MSIVIHWSAWSRTVRCRDVQPPARQVGLFQFFVVEHADYGEVLLGEQVAELFREEHPVFAVVFHWLFPRNLPKSLANHTLAPPVKPVR